MPLNSMSKPPINTAKANPHATKSNNLIVSMPINFDKTRPSVGAGYQLFNFEFAFKANTPVRTE